MKPALQLHHSHQLAMTPQLQKAIRLLQLSAHELHTEMQLALETNPMLEINEEFQLDTASYTTWGKSGHHQRDDDAIDEAIAMAASQENSTLQEYLLWQLNLLPVSEAERWVATYLIDAINDDGFIEGPYSELIDAIQSTLAISARDISLVLKRIQQFDPIGVGARDLQECMLLQLAPLSPQTPGLYEARTLVENYLPLLGKRDFTTLKKKLGISAETLETVITLIQTLNPRPGTQIGRRTTHYRCPDLYAHCHQKTWGVTLNPLSQLQLRVNPFYTRHLPKQNARDAHYIKQQLQEAHWLLNSIEHRNQTLLKVGSFLVEYQAPFLTLGDEALKPLDLTQVAQHLNMHESTISRITMQKTMDTPRGLVELKSFFSNPISIVLGRG